MQATTLATKTMATTDTKYRYVNSEGRVVTWNSKELPTRQALTIDIEGEVTLTIDIDGLLRELGPKALRSKTRKSVEASGKVVVTARVTSSKASDWK